MDVQYLVDHTDAHVTNLIQHFNTTVLQAFQA